MILVALSVSEYTPSRQNSIVRSMLAGRVAR